jgi:hypothetical protein
MNLSSITATLLRTEHSDRYLAAFIFEMQDPFIKVIVEGENCINLSHITIDGTTIGISFVSFDQFEDALKQRRQKNQWLAKTNFFISHKIN